MLLPLLVLILGIMDTGMALFVRGTLQNAVHEGARYAITYATQSTNSSGQGVNEDQSIKSVVVANSLGFLTASQVSVNYYDGQFQANGSPPTLALVTGTNSNQPGNVVEVGTTGFSWHWMTAFIFGVQPLAVSVSSADRTEPLPFGTLVPTR